LPAFGLLRYIMQMGQGEILSSARALAQHTQDGELKDEITLLDDDPRLVALMIDNFYQLTYDDAPIFDVSDSKPVETADTATGTNQQNGMAAVEDELSSHGFGGRKKDKRKLKEKIALYREGFPQEIGKSAVPPVHLPDDNSDVNISKLSTNALMYSLADKYGNANLKALARDKFAAVAAVDWQSKAFAHAAELVCETMPRLDMGLRKIIVHTVADHRGLLDYEEISGLLDCGNGLAWSC